MYDILYETETMSDDMTKLFNKLDLILAQIEVQEECTKRLNEIDEKLKKLN